MSADSTCPACGIYFHKWEAAQMQKISAEDVPTQLRDEQLLTGTVSAYWQRYGTTLFTPRPTMSRAAFYGRCAALFFMVYMGWRMAALDYRNPVYDGLAPRAVHMASMPFHEFGHFLMLPFGTFMMFFGGTLFQETIPLALGLAFVLKNRDNFAAAVCLWWAGTGLTHSAAYIYDALYPQLASLFHGEVGGDGHDWIYLLNCFGQLRHAHQWAFVVHKLAVLVMITSVAWGAIVLWRQRDNLDDSMSFRSLDK